MNLNPLKANEPLKPEEFKFKLYMNKKHKDKHIIFFQCLKILGFKFTEEFRQEEEPIYFPIMDKYFTKEELEYVNSLPDDENLIDEDGFLNE